MMSNYRNQVTQGQFSFLPDLTDEEITLQIKYALDQGYAINVEYTDDPHPRNTYWEMYGFPMFDMKDPAGVMVEIQGCRKAFSNCYIRVMASDATRGTESQKMSFIVNRPAVEPGFRLLREEREGRCMGYTIVPYACDMPEGERGQ